MLLEDGADPNARDERNQWPLLLSAASRGLVDMVALLVEYRADVELANPNGTTALILACQNGHLSTVRRLLHKHHASHLTAKMHGVTALHAAW